MKKPASLLFLIALLALAVGAPMYVRAAKESSAHLARGNALLERQQLPQAFAELRQALSWELPLSTTAIEAKRRLEEFAFDANREPTVRIRALEELIRGLQSSRDVLAPRVLSASDPEMAPLLQELDKLTADQKPARSVSLKEKPQVDFKAQLLAQIAFWGWIGAALWCIWRGFSAQGTVNRAVMVRGLVALVLLYGLWLGALTL